MNNDILDALMARAGEDIDSNGAITRKEMMKETGMSRTAVMRRLAELKDEGRLTVIYVKEERVDGQMGKVPAYKLREPEEQG